MEKYYFQTKDFAVGYEGKSVVSDINIGIRKGEILTLVGPNGSGKSTFLKSIIRQLLLINLHLFIKSPHSNFSHNQSHFIPSKKIWL